MCRADGDKRGRPKNIQCAEDCVCRQLRRDWVKVVNRDVNPVKPCADITSICRNGVSSIFENLKVVFCLIPALADHPAARVKKSRCKASFGSLSCKPF